MGAELLVGRDILERLGSGLDDLHRAAGAPVTARRPWLQCWIDTFPDHDPLAVVVTGGDGRLEGAALLSTRRGRASDLIVALGDGPSDAAMLAARSGDAADRLAEAVVDALQARRRGWHVQLRHLVPQDLVAPRLAARFARAALVPGDHSPTMRVQAGGSLQDHVSRRHPGGIRRIRNRMTRHELDPVVRHLTSHHEVMAVLPEVERVCRARDASLGRRSELDDPSYSSFFRRTIEVHAARGEVCLTTLTLDAHLAAYTLCFLEGRASRMWNCRFDPRWSAYSPGKLAMDEAVNHAVAGGCEEFDFMRGEEPYKQSYANDAMTATDLHAWSGSLVRARSVTFLRAREVARRMERSGGRQAAAVGLAKRLRAGAP